MCLLCLTRGQNGPSILTPELPILPEDELAFRHSEDTARITWMMRNAEEGSATNELFSRSRGCSPRIREQHPGSPLSIMIRDWTQPYLA